MNPDAIGPARDQDRLGWRDSRFIRWQPVWRRNARVWSKLAAASVLGNFGEPLLYLLALGYGLGGFVGRIGELPYLSFLASGIVCSSAMVTASFEGMYSAYTRMAVQRSWDAMLATPLAVADVVLGEALWAATKSLISSVAILIVASLLGAVSDPRAVLALPVVALTGLAFAGMALVITALARSYDFFLYYNTLVLTPVLLLSGVFFPLDTMPAAVQWGATALPLYHAVALVRPLLTGGVVEAAWLHLVVIGGYAVAMSTLAVLLIKRRLQA